MRRTVKRVDLAWFSPFRLKGCQELAAEQGETVFKNDQKESTRNEQRQTIQRMARIYRAVSDN